MTEKEEAMLLLSRQSITTLMVLRVSAAHEGRPNVVTWVDDELVRRGYEKVIDGDTTFTKHEFGYSIIFRVP